ncbi:MAG: DUF424 family protein [Candidatus Aenigmatarchaeota archaeon]
MRFCIKIHKNLGIKILAICDENVLEKEFEFKGIKIKISKSFYFERYVEKDELIKILREENFDVINAFGNNSVNLLIELKLINEKNILIIGNEKHAILQIL